VCYRQGLGHVREPLVIQQKGSDLTGVIAVIRVVQQKGGEGKQGYWKGWQGRSAGKVRDGGKGGEQEHLFFGGGSIQHSIA
jgi:hypothetical protein